MKKDLEFFKATERSYNAGIKVGFMTGVVIALIAVIVIVVSIFLLLQV